MPGANATPDPCRNAPPPELLCDQPANSAYRSPFEIALFEYSRPTSPQAVTPSSLQAFKPHFALATIQSPTSVNTSGATVSSICAYSSTEPVFAVWKR